MRAARNKLGGKYNRKMIIFEYKVSPAWLALDDDKRTSYIRVTDEQKDNVTTFFSGKAYHHTLPKEEIDKIIAIIANILGRI